MTKGKSKFSKNCSPLQLVFLLPEMKTCEMRNLRKWFESSVISSHAELAAEH